MEDHLNHMEASCAHTNQGLSTAFHIYCYLKAYFVDMSFPVW